MSAPQKPWEQIGVNSNSAPIVLDSVTNYPSHCLIPEGRLQGGSSSASRMASNSKPPPLPPRANATNPSTSRLGYGGGYSNYGGYNQYSNMYGSGYGGYGGLSGYGFNRFGSGYNNNYNGDPYNPENSFLQLAEESSRNAFQSIESIVQAFGSVSMMLESTFHAVYSSFRAVVGVADHVSKLKTQMAQMASAFAIVRTLRWLYRKLLQMLGLRKGFDPNVDDAWSTAQQDFEVIQKLTEADLKRSKSSWPIIIFFAVVFGTPWLIWRILQSVTASGTQSARSWMTGEGDHFIATAEFDFTPESDREVPFRAGQELKLAPKELQPRVRGWLLATVDGKKAGLVPANYLKIHGKRHGTCSVQVVQPIQATTSERTTSSNTTEPTEDECFSAAFQETTNTAHQV